MGYTKMNKKELQTNIDKMQAELDEMKAKLNEPDDVWPKTGDFYYIILATGAIQKVTFDKDSTEAIYFEIGNAYRTKQEAEDAVKRRKIEVRLQNLADKMWKDSGEVIDFKDSGQEKRYIRFNGDIRYLYIGKSGHFQILGSIVFPKCALSDITSVVSEEDIKFLMGVEK